MNGAWTAERLDDLADGMREGFRRVDGEFARVDRRFEQVDKRFEQVDKRFEQVDKRFDDLIEGMREGFRRVDDEFARVDKRIEQVESSIADLGKKIDTGLDGLRGEVNALNRAIIRVGGGMMTTMLVGFLGVIGGMVGVIVSA